MANTILLADDSITIRKIVDLTFSGEGIDVVTVGNGEAALKKVNEIHPDVVLADIFMPGRNGYEVCEQIKNTPALRHIPVILLTGAYEPFDGNEAARVKADGHMTKPFDPKVLISAVNSLISAALKSEARKDVEKEPEPSAVVVLPEPGEVAESPEEAGVSPLQESVAPGLETQELTPMEEMPAEVSVAPEPELALVTPLPTFGVFEKVEAVPECKEEPVVAVETVTLPETLIPLETVAVEEPVVAEETVVAEEAVHKAEFSAEELVVAESITVPPEKGVTDETAPAVRVAEEAVPSVELPAIELEETDPLGLYAADSVFAPEPQPTLQPTIADSRNLVVDIWEPKARPVPAQDVLPELVAEAEAPAVAIATEAAQATPAVELGPPSAETPPVEPIAEEISAAEPILAAAPKVAGQEDREGVAVPMPVPVEVPAQPMVAVSAINLEDTKLIDLIVNKVVEKLSRDTIEKIAWEVVPDLAEMMIKEHVQTHFRGKENI
jgi:CheY-like chemotaxis protein